MDTVVKKLLIEELLEPKMQLLLQGEFYGKAGNASHMVYGEKGIGKTTALRNSMVAASLIYDHLLPIYIEYQGSTGEELLAPLELIYKHLKM